MGANLVWRTHAAIEGFNRYMEELRMIVSEEYITVDFLIKCNPERDENLRHHIVQVDTPEDRQILHIEELAWLVLREKYEFRNDSNYAHTIAWDTGEAWEDLKITQITGVIDGSSYLHNLEVEVVDDMLSRRTKDLIQGKKSFIGIVSYIRNTVFIDHIREYNE